jgi:4-amino-4-deoxy-L-arabinose transferase-like glycosyltransferase
MDNLRSRDRPRPLLLALFALVEVAALIVTWAYELKLAFVALAALGVTIGTALLLRSYVERRGGVSGMSRPVQLLIAAVTIALVLALAIFGEFLLIRALSLVAAAMITLILVAGMWLMRGQRRPS